MSSATKDHNNTLVLQQDSTDCGVACLRSLVRLHGGEVSLERLRELSGTNRSGTTLLGMCQAARTLGFAAALLGLGMALLGMVMAVFSQRLIDDILPSGNGLKLMAGVTLVAFLLLVRVGFETLRSYLLIRQSRDFNNRIIGGFYDSLLHLPKAFFDTRKTGDLVARMNDTARIQRVIGQLSGQVLIDALMVVVSLGFIFFYSKTIALGLLVALPLYFFLIFRFHPPIRAGQQRVMASCAHSESHYISTLQGIRAIKSLNRQAVFGELNRQVYGLFQTNIMQLGVIQVRLNAWASVAGVLLLMGVLGFASRQVLLQNLQTGELMALLGLASSLLPSVANLALLAVPLNEAKVAFERMYEFVGLDPEPADENPDAMPPETFESIALRDLTFRFPGRAALLSGVSLRLQRGKIVGLIGESGSGKSTLVQILERFYAAESGQIMVNDAYPLTQIPLAAWRQRVAAVPQEVAVFNGTLLDNVLLGQEATPEAIEAFFAQEPFRAFVESLPQGLLTLVGEEGINLSGGQKQWVGLMRALWSSPQVLLLDEATRPWTQTASDGYLRY